VEPEYRRGVQRYVKEGIVLYGVRANVVRRIASDYYMKIRKYPKASVFNLCETLLSSGYSEEKVIAFAFAFRMKKQYEPGDYKVFESWLKKCVSNWGACDDFCRHAFGALVCQFPQYLPDVVKWTRSRNRWLRRGAAVVMIYSLRKGKHLITAFRIADALLGDEDYLAQSGYGWMLKDASLLFPVEVFDYVMRHKRELPRRALRYAIERFNCKKRHRLMDLEVSNAGE